jgi:hypothetical protein
MHADRLQSPLFAGGRTNSPVTFPKEELMNPSTQPTRKFEWTGDAIASVVEQTIHDYDHAPTRDAALEKIQSLCAAAVADPPATWRNFIDCANTIVTAASLAISQRQRTRLGDAGIPYLRRLLTRVKQEEERRAHACDLFISPEQIATPDGVDRLIACLSQAMTKNQELYFQ